MQEIRVENAGGRKSKDEMTERLSMSNSTETSSRGREGTGQGHGVTAKEGDDAGSRVR
jgi:hypothetical protein